MLFSYHRDAGFIAPRERAARYVDTRQATPLFDDDSSVDTDSGVGMTPRVVIRDVLESDLPILYAQQNDPPANAMAAFPPKEWEPFMAHWQGMMNDPNVSKKTIAADDKVPGNVLCFRRGGRESQDSDS
jgi:RimJ/RimL family protein N-acetyltransferase